MSNPDRPELTRHFVASLQAVRADHALTVLGAILNSDHRADYARIAVPTLLLHARHDVAVPPEVVAWLRERVPGARGVTLDVDGHLPHVVAPDAVAAALREFLGVGAAPAV